MTMPNNVTNVVIFHGDEQRIREILEAIQMEDIGPGSIDFDKVILMPPSLNIEWRKPDGAGPQALYKLCQAVPCGGRGRRFDFREPSVVGTIS